MLEAELEAACSAADMSARRCVRASSMAIERQLIGTFGPVTSSSAARRASRWDGRRADQVTWRNPVRSTTTHLTGTPPGNVIRHICTGTSITAGTPGTQPRYSRRHRITAKGRDPLTEAYLAWSPDQLPGGISSVQRTDLAQGLMMYRILYLTQGFRWYGVRLG